MRVGQGWVEGASYGKGIRRDRGTIYPHTNNCSLSSSSPELPLQGNLASLDLPVAFSEAEDYSRVGLVAVAAIFLTHKRSVE